MEILKGYFDESGTHDGSRFVCVAGYVFTNENSAAMEAEWRYLLTDYDLPYFHMAECSKNIGIYRHLSAKECDDAARRAIGLIKRYASCGLAASVDAIDFPAMNLPMFDSAYSFACFQMLIGIKAWTEENKITDKVAYYFEDGAKHEGEAKAFMQKIISIPWVKDNYHHASHTFASKKDVLLLQCADILAWHWYTKNRREIEGIQKLRADFKALLSVRHRVNHYDERAVRGWRRALEHPAMAAWLRESTEALKRGIIYEIPHSLVKQIKEEHGE